MNHEATESKGRKNKRHYVAKARYKKWIHKNYGTHLSPLLSQWTRRVEACKKQLPLVHLRTCTQRMLRPAGTAATPYIHSQQRSHTSRYRTGTGFGRATITPATRATTAGHRRFRSASQVPHYRTYRQYRHHEYYRAHTQVRKRVRAWARAHMRTLPHNLPLK